MFFVPWDRNDAAMKKPTAQNRCRGYPLRQPA
jgi:hypothetical protein